MIKIIKEQLKKDLPEIRPGYIVKVYHKVQEKNKERIQVFEGLVIAKKHGKGINATITVRKESHGVGVECIFPLHSPIIEKIEVIRKAKVRRAKLYYMRQRSGRKARMKIIHQNNSSKAKIQSSETLTKKESQMDKNKKQPEEK